MLTQQPSRTNNSFILHLFSHLLKRVHAIFGLAGQRGSASAPFQILNEAESAALQFQCWSTALSRFERYRHMP